MLDSSAVGESLEAVRKTRERNLWQSRRKRLFNLDIRKQSFHKPDRPGTSRRWKIRIRNDTESEFEWGDVVMAALPVDVSIYIDLIPCRVIMIGFELCFTSDSLTMSKRAGFILSHSAV